MANQYGTKGWAKWAEVVLDVSILLLKEPDKEWVVGITHKEAAIKNLGVIKNELDTILNKQRV